MKICTIKAVILMAAICSLISSCKKCQSLTLCPSVNTQFMSVHGADTCTLYVPNVFTPNGDGLNDYFLMFGRNISNVKCMIYDGSQKVYELDNLSQWWDGSVNGGINSKVYTIQVTGLSTYGDPISINGTVSIIGGQFFGTNSQSAVGDVTLNTSNARFPVQGLSGVYDPTVVSGEAFITTHVTNCQ